ncbi:MAG: hypothetical protein Q9170_006223 [Blastenia crenularia]
MPYTSNTPGSKWQWNPYKVLDIHPESTDFFCVGRAVSRGNARCRMRIDSEDIHDACIILDKLATEGPEDSNLKSRLQTLARLTLCKDWHQNQIRQTVQFWTDVVKDWLDEKEELRALRKKVEASQRKMSSLDACIKDRDDELKTLRSACKRESRSRHDIEVRLSETTHSLSAKCQEYQELHALNLESRNLSSHMEANWLSALKMVEVSNQQLAQSAEEADTYAKDLQDVIDRSAKEIQDLQKEIEDAHKMAEKYSSAREAWDLQRMEQQQELELLRQNLRNKEECFRMANDDLQEEIARRKQDGEQAMEECGILRDQLRRLRTEADESTKRATSKEEQLQKDITTLEDVAQQKEKKNQDLSGEIVTLRTEHSDTTHKFQESLDALAAQRDRLKTEARNAYDREEALHQTAKQLQMQSDIALAAAKAEANGPSAEASALHKELSETRQALNESTDETRLLHFQIDHAKDESLKAQNDHQKTVDHLKSILVAEQNRSEELATNVEHISCETKMLADEVEETKVSENAFPYSSPKTYGAERLNDTYIASLEGSESFGYRKRLVDCTQPSAIAHLG